MWLQWFLWINRSKVIYSINSSYLGASQTNSWSCEWLVETKSKSCENLQWREINRPTLSCSLALNSLPPLPSWEPTCVYLPVDHSKINQVKCQMHTPRHSTGKGVMLSLKTNLELMSISWKWPLRSQSGLCLSPVVKDDFLAELNAL